MFRRGTLPRSRRCSTACLRPLPGHRLALTKFIEAARGTAKKAALSRLEASARLASEAGKAPAKDAAVAPAPTPPTEGAALSARDGDGTLAAAAASPLPHTPRDPNRVSLAQTRAWRRSRRELEAAAAAGRRGNDGPLSHLTTIALGAHWGHMPQRMGRPGPPSAAGQTSQVRVIKVNGERTYIYEGQRPNSPPPSYWGPRSAGAVAVGANRRTRRDAILRASERDVDVDVDVWEKVESTTYGHMRLVKR